MVSEFKETKHYTFFSPEDDLKKEFLTLIDSAKRSIYIVDYSFNMVELIELLNKKHKEGLDIKLALDRSQEAVNTEKEALAKLELPKENVLFGESSEHRIIHDKFCVIDGEIVESGSWNYTEVASLEDNFIDIIYSVDRAKKFTEVFNRIYNRLSEV